RLQLRELTAAADEGARVGRQGKRSLRAVGADGGELRGQLTGQLRQLAAPVVRPILVAVLGQQVSLVQRQSGSVGGGRSRVACTRRGALEQVDVDVGRETEHFVAHLDCICVERAPSD